MTEFSLFGEKLYLPSPILDLCSSDLVIIPSLTILFLSMVTTIKLDKAFEKILDGTGLILHSTRAGNTSISGGISGCP